MVTQTWIVLALFIMSILFSVGMTIGSPYYRVLMYNSNKIQAAFFVIAIFITGILMVYGSQCSVAGAEKLALCNEFSWILVGIMTLAFAAHIGYGIYAHVALKKNDGKNNTVTAQ